MRRASFLSVLFLSVALIAQADAASKSKIENRVSNALERFHEEVTSADELLESAAGVLVFPRVVKAGMGFGGEFGEGALQIGGKTVDYYRLVSGSVGWQLGGQVKSKLLLFMNTDALNHFRKSSGWEAGVDGSVAVVTLGAGGEVDTNTIDSPILGFVISNKGLMYNLSFEGAKISKIDK